MSAPAHRRLALVRRQLRPPPRPASGGATQQHALPGRVVAELAGGVVVRYPTLDDATAFMEMHHTLRDERVMARRLTFDTEGATAHLQEAITDNMENRRSYLVAQQGEQLIGEVFLAWSPPSDEAPEEGTAVTLGICIVEAATDLGIGTRLMELAEQEARRMGGESATVRASASSSSPPRLAALPFHRIAR